MIKKSAARMAGLGLAFGLLPGCGNPTIESKISEGIVTSTAYTSESQYITTINCTPVSDGKTITIDCAPSRVYVGEEDTITVTVQGCKTEAGKKVIANADYLKSHQKYPDDFPIVGGHFTEEIVEENQKVDYVTTCSYDVELEFDYGKKLSMGDLVVMSELYGHDI